MKRMDTAQGDARTGGRKKMLPAIVPLTESQKGIYLECVNDPETVRYNVPVLCRLPEGIDYARFASAVRTVLGKHPALNATFGAPDGIPSMRYDGKTRAVLTERELPDLASARDLKCLPFDFENGPLCRFELIRTPEGGAFRFEIHHLVCDGTSVGLILRETAAVYGGADCPDEEMTLFECAELEAKPKDAARTEEYRAYFRDLLGGIECDSKPIRDQVAEDVPAGEGMFEVAAERLSDAALNAYAKKHGISENAVLLGAFGYTLAKYNGTNESFFTTASHGRFMPELAGTVGMFVRTLPVACAFDEKDAPETLLKQVYESFYRVKQNDCVPFGELAEQYGANIGVTFVNHADFLNGVSIKEGKIDLQVLSTGESVSALEVGAIHGTDGYRFKVRYEKSEYTEAFARGFLRTYLAVLNGMMTAKTLGEISLTDTESLAELDRFNQTEKAYDTEHTVVDLFRAQAKKTPDADCVVYRSKHWSYRETDGTTDRLAWHLLQNGVGKGSVVGILIPRCEYMTLAPLGVLKSGAAYMPMDPTYPPERLNLMMRDSGASFLITTPELSGIVDDTFTGTRMMIDEIPQLPPVGGTLPTPDKEDLFVLLYTSGSTGTPKGVRFAHSNTMVTAAWVRDYFSLGVGSNVSAYASFGFDANVFDTYPVITSGAALHIIAEDIRLDLLALQKYFNENGITHAVMTTQVGRQFALMEGTTTLRHLSVAGEKLTPLAPPKGFNLYNLYGPTEGSVLVSGFRMDKYYKDVPIGKAIDNVRFYVVDPTGRRLPAGAVGELWFSGAHVTGGYLNRPEKTAEAYGDNPFEPLKGYEKIYRTGDVVRLMHDGNLQFVGRRDAQVKVRGFRVELTEIEEVVRRFDGIRDATVAAFDDPAGGKFVCAYVVSDSPVDVDALNSFIRAEKPPYMVPAVTMQIEKIPLNQNQKVNKKALPKPERRAERLTAPENDFQQKIFDVIAEVLGHREFGVDTDLSDAGLTSIGAVRLNVALAKAFDHAVRIADLKANPTVRQLEKFLSSGTPAETFETLADYPITGTQNGIFVESMAAPDTTAYNIPVLFRLGDKVDPAKLERAVTATVNAHPYVKTTLFSDANGNVRAKRNDAAAVNCVRERVETLPAPAELVRPFRLLGEPLYRVRILETPTGNYLFMDFHHLVCDGTSEGILLDGISRAYRGETLMPESFSGYEIALAEERARAEGRDAEARAYWKLTLDGCDTASLPQKSPEGNGGAGTRTLTGITDASLVEAYCAAHGLTLNAFFNAVFSVVLAKFTNKESLTYATIFNGRDDSRTANSVSMLVKTLPVVADVDWETSAAGFAASMQTQLLNGMTNDLCPFAELAGTYGVNSDVLFAYQGSDFNFDTLCGEPAGRVDLPAGTAKLPISVNVYRNGGGYEYVAEYRPDTFSAEFADSLLDALASAANSFVKAEKLKDVTMLSARAEAAYGRMNATALEVPPLFCHRMIERYAAEHPDAPALTSQGRSLTYGELNSRANVIAHALIRAGVTADSIVGVMLERSCEIPLVQLAILKAGGAFLSVLPDYPDDRVEYCLSDAESPCVITSETIRSKRGDLFADGKPYRTFTVEELLRGSGEENPDLPISPDQLAYCIYTSGSTGKPKGVMIEHHNFTNMIYGHQQIVRYFHHAGNGTCLASCSVSFDASVLDTFLPLCTGKHLVICTDAEHLNPLSMRDLMLKYGVEFLVSTPSYLSNLAGMPELRPAFAGLKSIIVGAEAFPATLYEALRGASPDMEIINGYGPSECTVCCSYKKITDAKNITIGVPTPNMELFVSDKFGNILPPYAVGELIICGESVGRGYVKLPEKNAASYFELRGLRAYHSGDLVRMNGDGEIEFGGRMDNQVKLRGFRVELDEIENVMCSYPSVRQSKVLVRNNGSEDYLVGFYTAGEPVPPEDLTAYLKTRLTYYMVPAALMQLEQMPLTQNGKMDKKAFPEVQQTARRSSEKRAPKKSTEEQLCELFRATLSLDEFYADDNFFEMGGTSLSASKVTMQLMSKGIKVEYQDIFDHPTPESLGDYIDSLKTGNVGKAEEENAGEGPEILKVLQFNTLAHAAEVTREPLGDVLLTGAVGFLGSHVLRELIDAREGKIVCLVRKGDLPSPTVRLKSMLMYYFGDTFEAEFGDRITVLDADITDDDLPDVLRKIHYDTLINCAACVKHYAADDILERINVHGVENLIRCAEEKHARMIQISTTSIPGVHTEESYRRQVTMHENELFVIDSMDNKYGISKYHAELKMLDAIGRGLRGKIIRVGNLMGRHSDGEFQINFNTNAFLHALRGFATLGKSPISHATDPMRFSPIDMTAKAIVLLAGTNDQFTAFHADNRFGFDEMQLIDSCNRCGVPITPVDDRAYYEEYYRMLGDEKINSRLSGLVTNDRPDLHVVNTDNVFTANVLYRLGFSWPLVEGAYLDRAIESLLTLDYFGPDAPDGGDDL